MDALRQSIYLEKLHRITASVIHLQDIPALARAVKAAMSDYLDTWLGIIEGQEVVLYDKNAAYRFRVGEEGLVGWVAAHGEPLVINDIRKDPRYTGLEMDEDPTLSELVVPILEDGHPIGVLDLHADHIDAFTEEDLHFAESLARVLGVAIRNARLYENSGLQAERLALLAEVAADLTVFQSVQALVERTMAILRERLGYAYAGIALVEEDDLVVKADAGSVWLPSSSLRMRIGRDGLAGHVAVTGQGMIVPDIRQDPRYVGTPGGMLSALLVPIRSNARMLGVINVEAPRLDAFTQQDLRLLQTLADQVAVALENARLYQMLQEVQAQLLQSERLRAVGELAAGVAHNFNNLLTCVIGYAELLHIEPPLQAYRSHLHAIIQSAQQGARIARQLQEFARTHGSDILHPVDLNAVIAQAIHITEPRWLSPEQTDRPAIRLVTQLTDIPPIAGSTSELVEVFTNLILNGVDAMPDGGTLTITTAIEGDRVQAAVSDTGTGMDAETAARVFEPFFTTKGPAIGLGLGLSVVHGIVKRHGGAITVRSAPNIGTAFRVLLPVQTTDEEDAAPDADGVLPGLRILVIDDDENIRRMTKDLLADHEVDGAGSGEQGIHRFNERRHNVVFADIAMPGLSGWNVAHVVRQTDPTTVVVALTERGNPFSTGRRQMSDVDDILAKPFTREDLMNVLARAAKLRQVRTARRILP
jgi:signal transduction histidine kinase/CheY-like chemotaxis protein